MKDIIQDKSLRALIDHAIEYAQHMFDGDHEMLPTWLAVTNDDQLLMYCTPYDGEGSKDAVVYLLRKEFKDKNVDRYCHIAEAWVVAFKDDAEYNASKGVMPSQHPDRREILMVNGGKRGEPYEMHAVCNILRTADGPAWLSPMELQDYDGMSGRMTNMLEGTTPKH